MANALNDWHNSEDWHPSIYCAFIASSTTFVAVPAGKAAVRWHLTAKMVVLCEFGEMLCFKGLNESEDFPMAKVPFV